jgi:hypothetical protein
MREFGGSVGGFKRDDSGAGELGAYGETNWPGILVVTEVDVERSGRFLDGVGRGTSESLDSPRVAALMTVLKSVHLRHGLLESPKFAVSIVSP